MSATKKSINAKIADLKIEVQGGAGDGYFYFTSIETGRALDAESVHVSSMRHLPLSRWRQQAESAIEEDDGEAFTDFKYSLNYDGPTPKPIILKAAR